MHFNFLALAVAVPVAFVLGSVWNSPALFGRTRVALLEGDAARKAAERPSPWMIVAELARCLLLASTVGIFVEWLGIDDALHAVLFGLLAWLGFQAVLLSGGLVWESMPPRLYLIHARDALQKAIVLPLLFALI
jgi:hypothetical protein